MTLKDEILQDHSKQHTVYLSKKIGPDQDAFDALMILFLGDDYQITQQAAWIVSHCVDDYPRLIEKHLKSMIENLQKPVHVAVKRNTLRVLQFVEIPEELMGIAANICFSYLNSGREPVAIKAHSMTILYNIVKKFPELKEELKVTIENQMPFGSAGFISRGRKILNALNKMS